jgi:hypothetical protein
VRCFNLNDTRSYWLTFCFAIAIKGDMRYTPSSSCQIIFTQSSHHRRINLSNDACSALKVDTHLHFDRRRPSGRKVFMSTGCAIVKITLVI